jgi:DnaJ-domain-containing protein 1
LIASAVLWAFAAAGLDAGRQAGAAEPGIPTAIEEALIEHACAAMRPAGAPETDAYLQCRSNQLTSLREEFGRDLRRLSNVERRTIDSACSGLRISRGQDEYVECLTKRLAGLRGRGSRAKPDAAAGAVSPAPANPPEAVAAVAPPPPPSSGRSGVWIGAGLGLLILVAGGGAFVVAKSRRAFGTCRTCGVKLPERGDLCQKCRHEAADALRRAAAERAEQARAQEEEERRRAAREQELRQQHARDDEALRRQAEEVQLERARLEQEAQRQRDEDAHRQRQMDAAAPQEEFDPHAVLGVPNGATVAEIEAAYQAARQKYDLDLVADLGAELQEHFKRKAQAVERAYETLAPRRSD